MMRHSTSGSLGFLLGPAILAAIVSSARAEGPEALVRQVLQANPVIAPYNIATSYRNGQVVLSGVVGAKHIHDLAVRLAIATGYPVRDDLVIDTAATYRVVAARTQGPWTGPRILPYAYPPPLFGRLDDPFHGFEPPLVSYPPWGRAMARDPYALLQAPGAANTSTAPAVLPGGPAPPDGTIEMTIDSRGAATLRGTVPTLADRIAVGQKIAQTPGVSSVVNLLQVANTSSPETVPPPPQPQFQPQPQAQPELQPLPPVEPALPPAVGDRDLQDANALPPQPRIDADGVALRDRLNKAFAHRPALAGLPIKVTVRDGVATLSGKVPTVYEAMLAYRVVEQTPGIRDVVDRLEFVVPDGDRQNPLIRQGRPEDVEPYLTAQIRRHLGDLAHLDRVRLLGDSLDLRGSLVHAEDRPRLDAILRSIAVLRGFRIESHFEAE